MVRIGRSQSPLVQVTALIIGLLAAAAMPALAGSDADSGPSPAEIQKAAEQDPKICKRFKPTGSNIAKRYCFRKSTWDAMRENSQQALRDINDRASVNTSSGEGPR